MGRVRTGAKSLRQAPDHTRYQSRCVARFYVDVFEFQEEEKALEDPNFYLTDGRVTLVLTPWKIEDYHDAEHRGPGLDHVGFKVESVESFKKDF